MKKAAWVWGPVGEMNMEHARMWMLGILLVAGLVLLGCIGSGGAGGLPNGTGAANAGQMDGQTHVQTPANGTMAANQSGTPESSLASAPAQPTVYFFYLSTCGYSQGQIRDVNPKLKAEFPQVKWEEYEVSGGAANRKWAQMMDLHGKVPRGVPATIVGPDVVEGYYPGETEVKLRASIKELLRQYNESGGANETAGSQ